MRIKEIMNPAFAVEHDLTLKEAARIMSEKNIGSLIAVKAGKICGLVTERDILNNLSDLNAKIMSVTAKKIITISQEEDIDEAARIMAKNRIKRLPVVDKSGNLAGIVTTTDLIAHSEEIGDEFLFD